MRASVRQKGVKATEALLGPSQPALGYGIGLVGPNPKLTRLYIFGGWATLLLLALVIRSGILVPGFLVAWVIYSAIDAPVGVAITPGGVVVLKRSVWNGKPTRVIGSAPHSVLRNEATRKRRSLIEVPPLRLWMRPSEFEPLAALSASVPAAGQAPAAALPGWYPAGDGTPDVGYWDGTEWRVRRTWREGKSIDLPITPMA